MPPGLRNHCESTIDNFRPAPPPESRPANCTYRSDHPKRHEPHAALKHGLYRSGLATGRNEVTSDYLERRSRLRFVLREARNEAGRLAPVHSRLINEHPLSPDHGHKDARSQRTRQDELQRYIRRL